MFRSPLVPIVVVFAIPSEISVARFAATVHVSARVSSCVEPHSVHVATPMPVWTRCWLMVRLMPTQHTPLFQGHSSSRYLRPYAYKDLKYTTFARSNSLPKGPSSPVCCGHPPGIIRFRFR
ncbi:hypothetical protein OH77DRAFT_606836 [Trametes cingulata]|nr:hypothetical protein OH77DRAFT_606836 [Trametes cingulata]